MKPLTSAFAIIALLACSGRNDREPLPEQQPPSTEPEHIIAAKIPPDTLVDEKGNVCVIRDRDLFERLAAGGPAPVCYWQARE